MVNRKMVMVVDPTSCDGHGVCAEIFPERVGLDRWGFPIVDDSDIPPDLRDHALRAVHSCPRLALHLMEVRQPSDRVGRRMPDRTP